MEGGQTGFLLAYKRDNGHNLVDMVIGLRGFIKYWVFLLLAGKLLNLYNILCTVDTQHASRQDAIITIRLYLATCFGLDRLSSGQLRTILRYSKNSTQWDPIERYFYFTFILFLVGLKMAGHGRNM